MKWGWAGVLSSLLLAGFCMAEDQAWTLVVVLGAQGSAEYEEPFCEQVDAWEALAERGGHRIVLVGRDGAEGQTDKQRLREVLEGEDKQGDGVLWVVLIGHGTYDGQRARFNLRGPDVSAAELAEWLAAYERPVVVLDTSSASAPFLKRLAGPRRVVLTATRSGYEQSYTRFGGFLAKCFVDPEADLDKDNQVSLLEAFVVAGDRVGEFYQAEGRLSTEHALLDDNGDGLGTPVDWYRGVRVVRDSKSEAEPDGRRAHQIHLLPSPAELALPAEVRERRDTLEMEVFRLRDRKGEMEEATYYQALEGVLLRLAKLYESAERAERQTEGPVNEGETTGSVGP